MICLLCPVLSVIHGIYGKTIATSHKSLHQLMQKRTRARQCPAVQKSRYCNLPSETFRNDTVHKSKKCCFAQHDSFSEIPVYTRKMRDKILSAMVSGMCSCVLVSCLSILTDTTNTNITSIAYQSMWDSVGMSQREVLQQLLSHAHGVGQRGRLKRSI